MCVLGTKLKSLVLGESTITYWASFPVNFSNVTNLLSSFPPDPRSFFFSWRGFSVWLSWNLVCISGWYTSSQRSVPPYPALESPVFNQNSIECFTHSIRLSADMLMATGWRHSQSFQTAAQNLFLRPQIKKQREEQQQIPGGQANREGKRHPQLVLHYVWLCLLGCKWKGFLDTFILWMGVFCLSPPHCVCVCVCVPCTCLVPVEVRRGHWILGTRVTEVCEPPCGNWESNTGLLKE